MPALYENVHDVGCEPQKEDEHEGESAGTLDPESPDKTIEVDDRIYAMTLCPPPTKPEIWASQTTAPFSKTYNMSEIKL
ncbi:hypothetical protein C0989_001443 [Termitomyces sp. Mn162]|nr:hypothetical protein C0989_001443 [Termitomyces sp. Mn162]